MAMGKVVGQRDRLIRGRWVFEGAETMADVVRMLREEADKLAEWADKGWELRGPVEDDYGILRRTGRH